MLQRRKLPIWVSEYQPAFVKQGLLASQRSVVGGGEGGVSDVRLWVRIVFQDYHCDRI